MGCQLVDRSGASLGPSCHVAPRPSHASALSLSSRQPSPLLVEHRTYAFCPIFCFPLPSRLSLVWLSSSCYTPLGFLTLSVSWNYWKRAKKKKKKKKKKKREAKGNKNKKKKENRAQWEEENEGVSFVFHSRQAGVFRAAKTVQGSCQIKIFRSLAPLVCLLLLLPQTPPCYTFFLVCCCC